MKAYGVKYTEDELNASHFFNLPGKGGDIRSAYKDPADKAAERRISKRRARTEGRAACAAGFAEWSE